VIIQIESVKGVENIDKLLAYDQIHGAMVGPYDLSGSLGVPGELDHSLVVEASKRVVEACAKHGKACGTQIIEPDKNNIQAAFDSGFTFMVLSSDIFALWKWSENTAGLINGFHR
jgi:2-keto-3-deoxy-L-rhamnonate aldolase RhmA